MSGEVKILGADENGGLGAFRVPDDIPPDEIPARISEALAAAFAGGAGTSAPERSTDDIVKQLLGRCERYIASYGVHDFSGCPFRPGSLITPMPDSGYWGAGEPHIVLETREVKEPDFETIVEGGCTSNGFGARRDVRVGYIGKKRNAYGYASFWVESFEFQDYTP